VTPSWVDPLARAIDERPQPLEIFVRDDDAGWDDDRLLRLLDLCDEHACPIDLAAIPTAVSRRLVQQLVNRIESGAPIGVHQHGFSHRNHEREGRPCEFGPSRPAAAQRAAIAAGRRALLDRFGPALDPIFTPPWNRCTPATASCLLENGIAAISRDRTAGSLNVAGLSECPIELDWFARGKPGRLSRGQWAARAATAFADARAPVGLMLHHAPMDDDEFAALGDVIRLLAASPRVKTRLLRNLLAATSGGSI
jgi:predicted deacetylase